MDGLVTNGSYHLLSASIGRAEMKFQKFMGGYSKHRSLYIVPQSKRKEMLEFIHESHQGTVKSKQRARDILLWPGT